MAEPNVPIGGYEGDGGEVCAATVLAPTAVSSHVRPNATGADGSARFDRGLIWPLLAAGFVVWGTCYATYHLVGLSLVCPALVTFVVVLALGFDFTNGIHDAANSIATVVSTRVLTPIQAVVWAAFFNFVAAYFFGIQVAMTIGKGVVHPDAVDTLMILSGLLGAIEWNLLTWYLGLPTSSSHALIGGLAGAAIAKAGLVAVYPWGLLKIAAFIVLSPLIGLVLGFLVAMLMTFLFQDASHKTVDGLFRKGQLLSAALYSLGHGTNDAQKTMGIIALLLYTSVWKGQQFTDIPFWIVLICHTAMGMGTLLGGWRIVKTMGSKIVKLNPFGGFCAESGAAATLFVTAAAGIPVSTTHTIAGSIVGFGVTQRLRAVRWGVAQNIVWAWILTIPVAGVIGAVTYLVVSAAARVLGA